MPASLYPKGSGKDELRTIQAKCSSGGPSHRCQPNNVQTICTPAEMLGPKLPIGVKDTGSQSRAGVYGSNAIALEHIAIPTSKAEVFDYCGAAKRLRDDVVNSQ